MSLFLVCRVEAYCITRQLRSQSLNCVRQSMSWQLPGKACLMELWWPCAANIYCAVWMIVEPSRTQGCIKSEDTKVCSDPYLNAKLTLHCTHDEPSLLLVHILVYVICPPSAVRTQVVHAVAHSIELLGAFVELPGGPCTPSLICGSYLCGIRWVC